MKKILSLKPILVGLICAGVFNLLTPVIHAQSLSALGNLPLYFEAGPAPAAGPSRFITRGCNYQFSLSPDEVQITLGKNGVKPAAVRMDFAGANPGAQMSGDMELPGKVNYLMGNDPAAWRTGVPTFARVRVGQLYPGVDLVYYGNQRQLEYDFTLALGADPDLIKIHFDGADKISIGGQGQLILALGRDEIRQPAPLIYQMVAGTRQAVAGGYRLINRHTVAFAIGKYDHQLPLVIDPVLSFSTYFGGNSSDAAWSIALDTNGFIYIAGQTLSKQMSATNAAPFSTAGAFQKNFAGGGTTGDAFVAKFGNQGSNLVYLTYLGGSVDDVALCIAVDNAGNAFVGGYTDSPNFPVTPGAISTNISGVPDKYVHLYPVDGFVTELQSGGSNLVYSTYLGGVQADGVYGIALDSADNTYVTGFTSSTNFPITNALPYRLAGTTNALLNYLACPNSHYFNNNAFVTEIASNGTALKFSTYLGGTNYDWGNSIAVDNSNYIYVTGFSASTNFPTTNALQQQFVYVTPTNATSPNQIFTTNFSNGYLLNGSSNLTTAYDAFVAKLAPGGTGWVYSTFLGGTNSDVANGIAVDGLGNAYVTGWTVSTNFPNTATNVAGLYNGLSNNIPLAFPLITNAFLTQITWSGSNAAIGYSAVFGGTNFGGDVGYGVTLDASGNVYVVGASSSTNFPAINTPGLLGATNAGGSDAFVIVFSNNANGILYSGYLGGSGNDYGYGIAVDSQTNVYITGLTASANFPTFNPYQSSLNGPGDAFLAKIGWTVLLPVITTQPTNQAVAAGTSVSLVAVATGTPPLTYQWQEQGTNLIWTNLVNGGNISGATNATLTVNNAQTTNSGNYQLIVTNFAGSVTSSVVALTVTNAFPLITAQPVSQTIEVGAGSVGGYISFSISESPGTPPETYQWVKDGTNLVNGGTNVSSPYPFHIYGATNTTLFVVDPQTNDDGRYWLVITNPAGVVTSSNATLTVVSLPTIVTPPTNRTVGLGSSVTFTVIAAGTATLGYQWQLNGANLADGTNADGSVISGSTSTALTINNAQTNNDGGYAVIVTNSLGSVTSAPPAVLTVLTAPTFTGITAGTNGSFVFNGIGGTNNGTYIVLASTNLTTPLNQWSVINAYQFGSQGQFSFTNTPPTNTPQQFYLLQMP